MSYPDPPSAILLALPAPPLSSSSSSRRLPPPCWSHDQTVALIDAYRDKWYSLSRGNLKANHWQDVADAVNGRSPSTSQPKTSVQCRHKMEKLRKRYRTEIQRARSLNLSLSRFNSSWLHFHRMNSMEIGPSTLKPHNDSDGEDQDLFTEFNRRRHARSLNQFGIGDDSVGGEFRIRFPTGSKFNERVGDFRFSQNPNPNLGYGKGKRERDPVEEMVSAIKVLGDGYVSMEQMKMEVVREIETMRMEMEMKRTQMILESQHRIVEAFVNALSENQKQNKPKRMPYFVLGGRHVFR